MGRWNAASNIDTNLLTLRSDKARLLTKGDNNVADDTEL